MFIHPKAELKIKHAINLAKNKEVSWFGVVNKKKNGYHLVDILFPPQENSATFVTTKDDEYPEWMFKNITKKGLATKIRLHGHTHPNMGVSPSATDITQFDTLLKEVEYMIQFIINEKLDTHCLVFYADKEEKKELEIVWVEEENIKKELFYKMNERSYTAAPSNYGYRSPISYTDYSDAANINKTPITSAKTSYKPTLAPLQLKLKEIGELIVMQLGHPYTDLGFLFEKNNIHSEFSFKKALAEYLKEEEAVINEEFTIIEEEIYMMEGDDYYLGLK